MPPLSRTIHDECSDSRNSLTPHKLEHISELIRQKYPLAPNDPVYSTPTHERRWYIRNIFNETTGIILATIAVLITTPAAIYLLATDYLLTGFALFLASIAIALSPRLLSRPPRHPSEHPPPQHPAQQQPPPRHNGAPSAPPHDRNP